MARAKRLTPEPEEQMPALGKAPQPSDVAEAIMAGRIPHVKVEM